MNKLLNLCVSMLPSGLTGLRRTRSGMSRNGEIVRITVAGRVFLRIPNPFFHYLSRIVDFEWFATFLLPPVYRRKFLICLH